MKQSLRSKKYGKFSNLRTSYLNDKYVEKYYDNTLFLTKRDDDNVIIQTTKKDIQTEKSTIITATNPGLKDYNVGNNSVSIVVDADRVDIGSNTVCMDTIGDMLLGDNCITLNQYQACRYSNNNITFGSTFRTITGENNVFITPSPPLANGASTTTSDAVMLTIPSPDTIGNKTINLGLRSGYITEDNCIVIGISTGYVPPSSPNSILIGYMAGVFRYGEGVINVGANASEIVGGDRSITIGTSSGENYVGSETIAIGFSASATNTPGNAGVRGTVIGSYNTCNAGENSICIGSSFDNADNLTTVFCDVNNVHIGNRISSSIGVSPTESFVISSGDGSTQFTPNNGASSKGLFINTEIEGRDIGLGAQSNDCLFYDPKTYEIYYSVS